VDDDESEDMLVYREEKWEILLHFVRNTSGYYNLLIIITNLAMW
jgi:hypothetical protein